MAQLAKLEDDLLRKFYRSFHKHGPSNWAKVAKDTKITVEQCEMLHKQHMSFLSLPASSALETAFLALVNDHYNATQNQVKEEYYEDDAARVMRPARREVEDLEAQVAISTSQKPRRTPKPTPQRLAAEEEMQARRQARSNHGTPKSAKAKAAAKAPPSPPAGDWTSSQRKRSRRLFEENGEPDLPRYRSPALDRWRGRHNTDVDEGVDALLSLASGGHAGSALEDRPGVDEIATNTADREADADLDGQEAEPLEDAPKRGRGGRGARSTPTPTPGGTPVKSTRVSAAAGSEAAPAPGATGLRSPRARGAATAASAATTSGRGTTASLGRSRKDQLGSPTSSAQRVGGGGAAAGATLSAQAKAEASDAGAGAPSSSEAATGAADAGAVAGGETPPSATGRPVRRRKPSAIAIAAAAQADEEEGPGVRNSRSVAAAMAAAVAAASMSDPMGPVATQEAGDASLLTDAGGSAKHNDMISNTAALLASVPPVRTRGSARMAASNGPGSRRAGDQLSQVAHPDADAVETKEEPMAEPHGDASLPGPSVGRGSSEVAQGPAAGRGGRGQMPLHASVPSIRLGPARATAQPLPGRKRRRKSLPERLPPIWEPLKVVGGGAQSGATSGSGAAAGATDGAAGPSTAGGPGAGIGEGDGAAGPAAAAQQPGVERTAAMPAYELALRHCLGPRMRRWCMYEFFYSALDRPWFLRNELLEFCMHMQLPTTELTRVEWGVLRAALGRPRRLSLTFLREERLRLEGYRENVRLKYEEVAMGMEVPAELPRQLRVGQPVTARHPTSRQLHDGVILTVKGNKYRVQFHRDDLMTEVVPDTDVMPVDPYECMPLHMTIVPPLLNGRPYDPVRLAAARELLPGMALRSLAMGGMRPLGSWATALDTQMMRDQDAVMVSEVQRALEIKEGLVARLTQLNNEAASGYHTDEHGGRTENFQLQYTNVVLQLKETNAVLEAALSRLQSRQQQVIAASNHPFGPVMALQQQQQAAVAAAALVSSAVRIAGSAAALVQSQALPPPAAQTPPASTPQLPPPAGAAAASPMAAAAAGADATIAQTLQEPQPPQQPQPLPPAPQPTRSGPPGKPPTQPRSPGAPLVVPPQRPSAVAPASAASAGGPLAQAPFVLPPSALPAPLLPPVANPEQLVEQALVEARSVVDACRGKGADSQTGQQPLVLPPPAPAAQSAVPVWSIPLILPPSAVMPQQLVMPVPASAPIGEASAARPQQEQHQQQHQAPSTALPTAGEVMPEAAASVAGEPQQCGEGGQLAGGVAGGGAGREASAEPAAEPAGMCAIRVKMEEGTAEAERLGVGNAAGAAERRGAAESRATPAVERPMTEEELAESCLRDVIVGCVGVLFTIQKCTAGNVPASTVAEALDLAVQHMRIETEGENDDLYRDIVQSVQGLKGHLTRALA